MLAFSIIELGGGGGGLGGVVCVCVCVFLNVRQFRAINLNNYW